MLENKIYLAINDGESRHDIQNFLKSCGYQYEYFSLQKDIDKLSSVKDLVLFMDEEKSMRLKNNDEFKTIIQNNRIPVINYSFKDDVNNNGFVGNAKIQLPLNIDHFEDVIKLNLEKISLTYDVKSLENKVEKDSKINQLGELSSSLLHDLNNYLTICKSSFEVIDRSSKNLEQTELKNKINEYSSIGISGVNQIISFLEKYRYFLEGDKSIVEIEEIDLKSFIPYVLSFMQVEIIENKIKVINSIDKEFKVRADKAILLMSILNLVKNSLDSLKESPQKEIKISLIFKGADAYIGVIDSGKMDYILKDKIFERGFSTKSDHSNHGLGLYMVRKQLQLMDYDIELRDFKNTFFVIKIPEKFVV